MSIEYKKSNTEGARELYNKRRYYNAQASAPQGVFADRVEAVTDFIAEKYLYGRVNRKFTPIAITKPLQNNLRAFSATSAAEKNMRALHFVVDAFNAMAQQFRKCAMKGEIDPDDPYLSTLVVHRAFEDPTIAYQSYLKQYVELFSFNMNVNPQNPLKNFDQFEAGLIEAVSLTGLSAPLTYPAYIKNRRCPISVTGLAIEIGGPALDASDDEEKFAAFIDSRNWDFFVNAAATYGFMIDQNVPWRLVADIGSSAMIGYASAYGMNTTDDVLRRCFTTIASTYAINFPTQLFNIYEKSIPRVIQYTEECNGQVVMKQALPDRYGSPERLQSYYNTYHFVRLYCKIRFEEEESSFSDDEKVSLINQTVSKARSTNMAQAIGNFERIVNKTFDYRGSLGYYNDWGKSAEERKAEATMQNDLITAYGSIPQER
jgi:hypothetical protein